MSNNVFQLIISLVTVQAGYGALYATQKLVFLAPICCGQTVKNSKNISLFSLSKYPPDQSDRPTERALMKKMLYGLRSFKFLLCCRFFMLFHSSSVLVETQLCLEWRGRLPFLHSPWMSSLSDIINLLSSSGYFTRYFPRPFCWRRQMLLQFLKYFWGGKKNERKITNWDDNSTNELNIKGFSPPTQKKRVKRCKTNNFFVILKIWENLWERKTEKKNWNKLLH